MAVDEQRIDEAVLALLWLTLHDERRAWKGFDWTVLRRLHAKGLIADPVGRAKSVVLTDEGLRQSEALFRTLFTRPD
ncbi:DUF6429 family protein [Methylobacterium durans]|uniref:DUF6429 domain-containing protein n=1 Tax=Methylobacterium durans TaxID=2202825 RepID=A0A2U8W516_9HYPH|nr:DUF6429 family protein [Methylobacterium durans]AWN41169.1 hypothetical protein DK389_12340 [Methylobacterium durans]AWN41788.1 hypothetical protein DK389_16365 [Methylobacterium durans]AWN42820.1 hypothetical protein DK389_22860 [Methylobacterium durans]AWN43584.1 hypothetical protein DK389_27605 [Methylobacterium durans]